MPLGILYRRLLRYPLWRLANPTSPYEAFYAHVVTKRLERRNSHDAIGVNARPVRVATELLDVMVRHGMLPQHRFVDYGCGSLRLGRAVVDYLNPDRFFGLDVAELFLHLGEQFAGPRLMSEKRPVLKTITAASLNTIKLAAPDYVASWHVCSKVPDRQLERYFSSVIGLMGRESQAFIQFPQTAHRRRLNNLNWTLSKTEFAELAAATSTGAKVTFFDITPMNSVGVTETYGQIYFD